MGNMEKDYLFIQFTGRNLRSFSFNEKFQNFPLFFSWVSLFSVSVYFLSSEKCSPGSGVGTGYL